MFESLGNKKNGKIAIWISFKNSCNSKVPSKFKVFFVAIVSFNTESSSRLILPVR